VSLQLGGPATCPHCDRKFTTEHGMKVHMHRAHKDKDPDAGLDRRERKKAKDREGYARRKAAKAGLARIEQPPQVVVASSHVNFCPHCGQNIALVARALAIAEGVSRGTG
jgi:hypothetical protein